MRRGSSQVGSWSSDVVTTDGSARATVTVRVAAGVLGGGPEGREGGEREEEEEEEEEIKAFLSI